jgi:aryl-alcohol dehydrogenase-like predicted oxidoreductase
MTVALTPFGSTGLQVSTVSLGAMNFGGGTPEDDAERIVLSALDAGVNLIDTADIYHRGESEAIVGRILQRSGRRDEVLVATKCGMDASSDPNARGASRRHIISSCEASLRRLGTERIDLYQLHRPFFDVALEETLSAFDQLVRDGKVYLAGSSTHPAWFLMECLATSERRGWVRYTADQSPFNMLDRRAENELFPMCSRHGIATLPWSPLAGGILAGRYPSATDIPKDARAARLPALRARVTPEALDAAEAITAIAKTVDMTLLEFALVWVRDHPGVTSPIVGPRTLEQWEIYLRAAQLPALPAETRSAVDDVVAPGTSVSDFYNSSRWMPSRTPPPPPAR